MLQQSVDPCSKRHQAYKTWKRRNWNLKISLAMKEENLSDQKVQIFQIRHKLNPKNLNEIMLFEKLKVPMILEHRT